MMNVSILSPALGEALVDRSLPQRKSNEAQLLQLREYAALLPKLSDVVLATTTNQQDAIHDSINQCEKGIASIEKLYIVADGAGLSNEEADPLLSEITLVKNKIEHLRGRAEEMFGQSLESVASIRPLVRDEQVEIALCLKEKRSDFWIKLYQIPFVQEAIVNGLSRIAVCLA